MDGVLVAWFPRTRGTQAGCCESGSLKKRLGGQRARSQAKIQYPDGIRGARRGDFPGCHI